MKYFDAHTHTNFVAYKDDREEVIKRAKEAGVAINVAILAGCAAYLAWRSWQAFLGVVVLAVLGLLPPQARPPS